MKRPDSVTASPEIQQSGKSGGFFSRLLQKVFGTSGNASGSEVRVGSESGLTESDLDRQVVSGGESTEKPLKLKDPRQTGSAGMFAQLTADMLQAPQFLHEPSEKGSITPAGSRRTPTAAQKARRLLAAEQRQIRREAWQTEQRRLRANRRADQLARDITFLGQGVSGQLNERQSDGIKLASLNLPLMETPVDVAKALRLTIPQLRGLAFHADVTKRHHYIQFTIPKKSGGLRHLCTPHRRLADVQKWICTEILKKLPVPVCAQGFVAGRSILTNAQQHCGQDFVINMDLENFFPSITFPRVRKVLTKVGYSPAVSTLLALLCTECPRQNLEFSGQILWVATGPRGLPQGACTSPALSNQVCQRLDRRLAGLAAKLNLQYSRYADDLTFSGGADMQPRIGWLMARIRHIVQEEGFRIRHEKSRVQRRSMAQMVTGLVVNDRPGVPREDVRRLRAILHRAAIEGLEAQNRDGHPNFRAWVDGMIGFIGMARPELAAKFLEQLRRLPRGSTEQGT